MLSLFVFSKLDRPVHLAFLILLSCQRPLLGDFNYSQIIYSSFVVLTERVFAVVTWSEQNLQLCTICVQSEKKKLPCRESNPGRVGESHES